MTANPAGPPCGNNPNYRMSDGDRAAVESFRAYLTVRADRRERYAAAIAAADDLGAPAVCYPEAAAAMAVADAEQRAARADVLREAADVADRLAHEMRHGESDEWPEEWSSREVRDAVRSVGEKLRGLADEVQPS